MDDFNSVNSYNNGQNVASKSFSDQITRVYGWMFLGLIMTTIVSYYTAYILEGSVLRTSTFIVLALVELGLVWFLSARALKMQYTTAAAAFLVYSAINGITMSVIFYIYELGSIALVFGITAAFFGFMSVYGMVTKQDLTTWGNIFLMGLVGIIIASVINLFFRSNIFQLVISFVGVAVFLGLTAYDTQKIKAIHQHYAGSDKEKNVSIIGALTLYLDFINLFMYILRILGRKRD